MADVIRAIKQVSESDSSESDSEGEEDSEESKEERKLIKTNIINLLTQVSMMSHTQLPPRSSAIRSPKKSPTKPMRRRPEELEPCSSLAKYFSKCVSGRRTTRMDTSHRRLREEPRRSPVKASELPRCPRPMTQVSDKHQKNHILVQLTSYRFDNKLVPKERNVSEQRIYSLKNSDSDKKLLTRLRDIKHSSSAHKNPLNFSVNGRRILPSE